jgi:hypothetical protein
LEQGEEKGSFENLKDLRRQKCKAKWGRGFVMVGVFAEIVLGFIFAANEGRETTMLRQKNAEIIANIPPRNVSREQRDAFIKLLNDPRNVSKTTIKVIIVKDCDRETMEYAFELLRMLNGAGYGATGTNAAMIRLSELPDRVPR